MLAPKTVVTVTASISLPDLIDTSLSPHRPDMPATIVHDGFSRQDIGEIVDQLLSGQKPVVIDAGSLAGMFLSRPSSRNVDVDAIAPRLRRVNLPAAIVDAASVVAAIDARDDRTLRPELVLSLWSKLVPHRYRLAARLTGAHDGLTAEFLLARPPDSVLIVDRAGQSQGVLAVAGTDVIAVEVVALALREVNAAVPPSAPGPWEDHLVQRATELSLGCSGPVDIQISAMIRPGTPTAISREVSKFIAAAAERAGIDDITWT